MSFRDSLPMCAGVLALAAVPAFAATDPSFEIEEIVVTALRRPEPTPLQKTPMAISTISGETLDKRSLENVTDLLKVIPGAGIQDQGAGQRRLVVRGVNSPGEALTGLYYNESFIQGAPSTTNDAGQRMPELRLFDVERIEVLRGPQGTLYGASSMSGTVRALFNQPTSEFQARVTAGTETSEEGDPSYEANAMVNVPLVVERLATRVVGYHRDRGGYIDNVTLGRENNDEEKVSGGRVLVRYMPSETLTIDAAAYVQREDAILSAWELPAGTYKTAVPTLLPIEDDFELYSLTARWDLGFATLTGVASHFNRDLLATIDASRLMQFIGAGALLAPAVLVQPQDIEDDSYELRLSSNGADTFVWTVGAYFDRRDSFTLTRQLKASPATGLPLQPEQVRIRRTIDENLEQRALFGEVTLNATDALAFTVGARYFDYDKAATMETTVPFPQIGIALLTPPRTFDSDEDGVVTKVNVAYSLSDSALVYVQATEGFRPGGANQVVGLAIEQTPYEADSLWNYEVGAKTSWLDDRMTLNVAAFRIDWDNMQVTGTTPPNGAFKFISNAGAAQIDGAELELAVAPMLGLTLSFGAAYTDARLTEDQVSAVIVAPGREGDRIPNVPRVSAAFGVDYGRPLGAALYGSARVDVTHVGESFSELRPNSPFYERIPDATLTDLRLRLESISTNWNVDLFVNNVFDEVAIGRVLSSEFGRDLAVSAPPRTFGLSIGKSF
jgi:iron complex outermembrane receptor protein